MRDLAVENDILRLERDAFAQELYEINRYAAMLAQHRQTILDQFNMLQVQVKDEIDARDFWISEAQSRERDRVNVVEQFDILQKQITNEIELREYWVNRAKELAAQHDHSVKQPEGTNDAKEICGQKYHSLHRLLMKLSAIPSLASILRVTDRNTKPKK